MNTQVRVREVGWWTGVTNGSILNNGATGQRHGASGALNAGATLQTFPFQLAHALLGGASVFSRGFVIPVTIEPTRQISQVFDTHAIYLELGVHLRSAGDVDLPGQVRIFFNDLWPDAATVPNPSRLDLGDWVTNAWQEWEDWSPLSIPTPPPGFSSGGAAGIRYEYRRVLGRAPANFFYVTLTNVGTVAASEWGIGLYVRNQPPAWTR